MKKWLAKCRWHNPPLPCSGNVCFFISSSFLANHQFRVCAEEERRGEISRPPLKSSWNEAEKILSPPPPPFSHILFRPKKPGEFPLFCLPACTGGEGEAFVMRPVLILLPCFIFRKAEKRFGKAPSEKKKSLERLEGEREADMQNENTSPLPFLAMFWLSFSERFGKKEGKSLYLHLLS